MKGRVIPMKRSRFFERSYFLTLVLFLVLLNACIFSLALYTHDRSYDSAEQVCRSEQLVIIEAFERDFEISGEAETLALSYTTFYGKEGMYLRFARGEQVLHSNLPEDSPVPEAGTHMTAEIGGEKYLLISEALCQGEFVLTYAKGIGYLDEELRQLSLAFGAVSGLASVVLALCLYFVLRKLYAPLRKLQDATKAISRGDFSARAEDSGKDEFAELAKDFNAMSDTIREQMEELKTTAQQKQTMLDNLGHEMRTPLTSIYGAAEYSFRHTLTEEERMQTLLDIMSESKRLQKISRILLDSAFIRENGIQVGKLSAGSLMVKIQNVFVLRASEKQVKVSLGGGDFPFEGDETLIEILVANLTENAIRACKEGGEVVLGAEVRDGAKTLYIRDNGVGMTKEQMEHITEPFYRTDKARSRKEGGTGLGLALCKRIADAHGAELVFESEVGVGTTAYVRLP